MRWLFLTTVLATSVATARDVKRPPFPSESLYHWRAPLEDQEHHRVHLDVFAGNPVIISMFYSRCRWACPIILSRIKRIAEHLSPDVRARVRVVLVSMDPAHDTAEQMA